jgi:sortase B
MKSGSMFGKLSEYEDREFYESHQTFVFDTIREGRTYQVLAVFRTQVYADDDKEHFHYYDFIDAEDQEAFDEYVKQVKSMSQYQTDITAEYGDELLTLSTCAYHKEKGRFVVVAKRVALPGK